VQSCSSKLLPKAVGGSPQLLPKAPPQSECPKITVFQTCFAKQFAKAILQNDFKVAAERYSSKLFSKASSQSCGFSKFLFEAVTQSCSSKLFLLPKSTPQSCDPNPLSKITIENYSEKLAPKAAKTPR
jgi:hypothetical protein